jgi:hypothetical protein
MVSYIYSVEKKIVVHGILKQPQERSRYSIAKSNPEAYCKRGYRFIDIDVAALSLCSKESTCRFGSCYLNQNRLTGRSLYYSYSIAFDSAAVLVDVVVVVAVDYHSSILLDD